MKAKIKGAIALWNRKLIKSGRDPDPRPEGTAKETALQETVSGNAGRDKWEKAIRYFKQRHGNGGEPTSDVDSSEEVATVTGEPEQDVCADASPAAPVAAAPPHDVLAECASAGRMESSHLASAHDPSEVFPQSPAREAPDDAVRTKPGWMSPVYARCRAVQLNPAHLAENRCLAYLDSSPGAAYRMLRTHILQKTSGLGKNTIMITSALPREGKTVTAINLAFSLSREFQHTVLLVDGDLRTQSIHKSLGFASDRGLIHYLTEETPISELIIWPGIEKMTIISGGQAVEESAELLGSPRMREFVADVRSRYPNRYIIFDAPAVLAGADALTLASLVDHVIVVVQAGKARVDDVAKALQFIPSDKMLGFVVNRSTT